LPNSPPALLLIPAAGEARPDPDLTRQALANSGLIGRRLAVAGFYVTGNGFLDHISFLGCSPDLRLDPGPDDVPGQPSFVHISLIGLAGPLVFRQGFKARPPLCPACRAPAADYQGGLATWLSDGFTGSYTCQHCGASISPVDLVWRDGVVIARDAIEILGIHPSEAVPTDQFMTYLKDYTGIAWRYVYV